ncbi:MAG: RNA polymerase sigma factor [Patescibacteria group bacterium]
MKKFYKKYYKSIKSFVLKRVDDEGVAEELVNDILYSGMKSLVTYQGNGSEFSWLCGIAKHKIVDYYRKKKIKTILFSSSPVFEEVADAALSPERDCLKNELVDEIEATLGEINEGYKKILRLKYIDGLKVKEIAKVLKVSGKAVESKLIRAKKSFRLAWNYDKKGK